MISYQRPNHRPSAGFLIIKIGRARVQRPRPDYRPYNLYPYNLYRTSGDINPNFGHIMYNVNTVVRYLGTATQAPRSRSGAWAYPDMLEVGNGQLTYAESEVHFGLWVVTSSPLILGFDMLNDETMATVWPIISNTEAIAVDQQWHGTPGQLLSSRDASLHPDPNGFVNYMGALMAGDDLDVEPFTTVAAAEAWCGLLTGCQGFTFDSNGSEALRNVYFKAGIVLSGGRGWSSYVKVANAPPAYDGGPSHQVWAKRLGPADAVGGAPMAVLCVNAVPSNTPNRPSASFCCCFFWFFFL